MENAPQFNNDGPPRFAIVRLRPGDDVFDLFRLLIQHGYVEVSFVNALKDSALPWTLDRHSESEKTDSSPLASDTNSDSDATIRQTETDGNNGELSSLGHERGGGILPCSLVLPVQNSSAGSPHSHSIFGPPPITNLIPALGTGMSSAWLSYSSARRDREREATPPYAIASELQKRPTVLTTTGLAPKLAAHTSGEMENRPLNPLNPKTMIPLTTPATTQLRQRGSRAQSDDPNVYVACRLCHNKIMASRLSNLTNHVRRHSTLKQFQCCYCDYTHNEMAKVRLHMLHNHKDKDSQPIDNLSPEMQTAWDILMRQCFPDHYPGNGSGTSTSPILDIKQLPKNPDSGLGNIQNGGLEVKGPSVASCSECGQLVSVDECMSHVRDAHLDCYPYVCSLCGYDSADRGRVLIHISSKHEDSGTARVCTRDIDAVAEALIPKYFPPFPPTLPLSLPTLPHKAPLPSLPLLDPPEKQLKLDEPISKVLLPQQQTSILSVFPSLRPFVPLSYLPNPLHCSQGTNEPTVAENLRCQLCRKVLDGVRPLSSLLNHAKRHYHVKQFQCVECPYSSSEAAHVRSHMKLKHRISGRCPLDNRCPSLQAAWMQAMVRCFPSIAPRLKKFRFKNFRNKPSGRPRATADNVDNDDIADIADNDSIETVSNTSADLNVCDQSKDRESPLPPSSTSTSDTTSTPEESFPSTMDKQGQEEEEEKEMDESKRQCRLCNQWLNPDEQFQHATTHIPIKPFGCMICPFRTTDYQQLRAHLWKHKLIGGDRFKTRLANTDVAQLKAEYVKYCFGSAA